MKVERGLGHYSESLAGTLLAAREAVMRPIRPVLREMDITEQQWRVLRVLADEGSLDASSISDKAMLYAPTVTRILRDLNDRNLIVKSGDPEDGRRLIISITAAGKTLVSDTAAKTVLLLDAYTSAFGKERLANFIREARELAIALEPFSREG